MTAMLDRILGPVATAVGATLSLRDADGNVIGEVAPDETEVDGGLEMPVDLPGIGSAILRVERPSGEGRHRLVAAHVALVLSELLEERARHKAEIEAMATELLEKYEEITLLYGLSQALGSVFAVQGICEVALDKALQVIEAEGALVELEEEDGRSEMASRGSDAVIALCRAADTGVSGEGDVACVAVGLVPGGEGETVLGRMTLAGKAASRRFTAGERSLAATIATQLATAIKSVRLLESVREAERVEQEVELAARIQRSLLPARPLEFPGVEVAGRCVPGARVGGDLYDTAVDGSGRLGLVIADVTGHSVGSALLMAMARAVIRREITFGRNPADLLDVTNRALYDDLANAELFITIFYARYDPAGRHLAFTNGAHNPPLLRRASDGTVLDLDSEGMALGMLRDGEYAENAVTLASGDLVLFYTDGVVEARSPDERQFGEDTLRELVAASGALSPGQLVDGVFAAVDAHTRGARGQDDVTVLALRVTEDR